VDPIATHPWRTLEAPTETTAGVAPPPEPRAGLSPGAVKAVVAGVGAVACGILAFFLAFGGGSSGAVSVDGAGVLPGNSLEPGNSTGLPAVGGTATGIVVVEVVGAVPEPGVFRLPTGARVGELIAAAGGYSPRVDTIRAEAELNLAATLADGDRVRVPSRDDPVASARPAGGALAGGDEPSGPLDLNQATAEQLDTLPGVGPVTVEKIIAAREESPFTTVDELQSRGIVGEKTLAKLRELVTVG